MARRTTSAEDQAFGHTFLEQIIEHISDYFEPEDIFDEEALQQWAEDNGFVVVDDN